MTITETNQKFAYLAAEKYHQLTSNPLGFFISAMLAGAYVGAGIILILSVGADVDSSWRPLVMGASFGVALTLVVFAGSELYTGHTMYMMQGVMARKVTAGQLTLSWIVVWVGNLLGCIVLAAIAVTGSIDIIMAEDGLLYQIAAKKMHLTPLEMVARGILCNWLVCLALWTSARTESDSAKILLIFWCLFAFIASGFEHSIANMTVFVLALLSDHPDTISMTGAATNLFWVTLGNTISGVIFVTGAYRLIGRGKRDAEKGKTL